MHIGRESMQLVLSETWVISSLWIESHLFSRYTIHHDMSLCFKRKKRCVHWWLLLIQISSNYPPYWQNGVSLLHLRENRILISCSSGNRNINYVSISTATTYQNSINNTTSAPSLIANCSWWTMDEQKPIRYSVDAIGGVCKVVEKELQHNSRIDNDNYEWSQVYELSLICILSRWEEKMAYCPGGNLLCWNGYSVSLVIIKG